MIVKRYTVIYILLKCSNSGATFKVFTHERLRLAASDLVACTGVPEVISVSMFSEPVVTS
jgi:hypothetical protein